ncbi:hypothetical protein BV25DRAFT_365347 [Artomyces pyxidatus]|uniref:Uncharacterized protein n=1 Tax=Artomyces pyxidatus TaxID=48021 RepID=A0ACB8T5X6_9AGAM|nr:hypothetical protein BV25DRAFT_365347 [Artomyces pyxidatus]
MYPSSSNSSPQSYRSSTAWSLNTLTDTSGTPSTPNRGSVGLPPTPPSSTGSIRTYTGSAYSTYSSTPSTPGAPHMPTVPLPPVNGHGGLPTPPTSPQANRRTPHRLHPSLMQMDFHFDVAYPPDAVVLRPNQHQALSQLATDVGTPHLTIVIQNSYVEVTRRAPLTVYDVLFDIYSFFQQPERSNPRHKIVEFLAQRRFVGLQMTPTGHWQAVFQ